MYITINDIKGEKTIDLSYPIHFWYQDNYPPDNYPPDNYPRTNTPQTITPLGQIPPRHLPPLRNFCLCFGNFCLCFGNSVIWGGNCLGGYDLPRTNNAVEGWHRSFQANVGAYHPNFWRFIDILKREQNLTQVNIAQARAGHPAEPQRRRYQDSNQRIKNIVQDYPNCNIMQYLRGLAHNISM